jgi:hypothetical protein
MIYLLDLDMSNQDKCLIFVDVLASKYKIYIPDTQKELFYNMVRSRLAVNNLMEHWTVKKKCI